VGKEGTLVYTERAFEQDADQAMGADIVRALVELITNADDAYGSQSGPIDIYGRFRQHLSRVIRMLPSKPASGGGPAGPGHS